jgi:hypothetical protein
MDAALGIAGFFLLGMPQPCWLGKQAGKQNFLGNHDPLGAEVGPFDVFWVGKAQK